MKKLRFFSLCVFLFINLHSIAFAQATGELNNELGEDINYNFTGTMVKVIVVLAVIIGLIIVLVRFLAQKNRGWNANRSIRLLGGVALGQNKSLQIVEIAGRIYLIGVGNEVQLIEKIDDEETAAYIIDSLTASYANTDSTWMSNVNRWLKEKRPSASRVHEREEERETDSSYTFQEIFQSKVKNLANRKKWMEEIMEEKSNSDRSNDRT